MFVTSVQCRWCDWRREATVKNKPNAVGRRLYRELKDHVRLAHANIKRVNFCRNCRHDYVWHDMKGRCLHTNLLDGKPCNCKQRA